MISRRNLLSLAPAAWLAAPGEFARALQPAAAPGLTRVKIDAEQVTARVNPRIYGQFIEHLGRCIYGGIFEEGSPLSDAQGYRKDVQAAVERLRVPVLRWPGGNFVSSYHWEDGVGPRERRPVRFDTAWFAVEPNRFGTNEFIEYCRRIKAEPYLCINLGTGTVEEAANWVEYCNGTEDTHYAGMRRRHGYQEPHNVRIWGLGNEIYGMWQAGHKSAEDYAKIALEAAKMMKWVDPSIQLVACGAGDPDWNLAVLERLASIVDYISVHLYVGGDDYYELLGSVRRAEELLRAADSAIEIAQAKMRGRRAPGFEIPLPTARTQIAFDEWNVWYRKRDGRNRQVRNKLEEPYNLRDALWTASMLHVFQRWGDKVTMANMAQLVNVIAPIMTSPKGLYLQPNYFPMELYRAHSGDRVLHTWTEGPRFATKAHGELEYLDVCATRAGRRGISIGVVNRHRDRQLAAHFEINGALPGGRGRRFDIDGPSPDAMNSFESPRTVQIAEGELSGLNERFLVEFPPHSITLLEFST